MTDLQIKIFADGADISEMIKCHQEGIVSGFTSNPTLMRQAGVKSYEGFAKEALEAIPDAPISFEVFSDDFPDMRRQALKLNAMGENVYVKIPITNTKSESSIPLIKELTEEGVKVNVTAIMTSDQVVDLCDKGLSAKVPNIVSVFAGRISDTGRNANDTMRKAVLEASYYKIKDSTEILWASTRQAYDIINAQSCGCDIITVPTSILKKLSLFGKDLNEFSLETVKMFYKDATEAGYEL